tara:strand:+ start:1895 stop:3121 length:1227 start_codon:yes stop_codon:yes gene_type:complete
MENKHYYKQKIAITWPLTPYTGWGRYGIQLAKALISESIARPIVPYNIAKTQACELEWQLWSEQIEKDSRPLINAVKGNTSKSSLSTNCQIIFDGLGNSAKPHEFHGKYRVGVTFFERSLIPEQLKLFMQNEFDLIITGSNWNQKVLESHGINNSFLVHQGVDLSIFNPIPVRQLLIRPFIIFAGGKLESRKGQDIVIEAFRRFIKLCPNALLIGCWVNIGNIGINTLNTTPYILTNPRSGKAEDIQPWLISEGIPEQNILIPSIINNAQLPSLIKQADTAVFASRCEGGTNLMAMEALACGIPTLLSENTGHLDLLNGDIPHAIGIKRSSRKTDTEKISEAYGGDDQGVWGETDPDSLVEEWIKQFKNKSYWKEERAQNAATMNKWSWEQSMDKLINKLHANKLILS